MQRFKGELILLITALIWGFAFVFQSTAADYLGAFTFNGLRFLVGALSLLPIIFFASRRIDDKKCIKYGIILGLFIAIAANLQQMAMSFTTSGKAGFITSLYMIFVPILGFVLFRYRANKNVIVALMLGVGGLYLINGASLSFEIGDLSLILCAVFFALQIIFVDRFAKDVNSVQLSFIQYLVAGLLSMILGFVFDDIDFSNILSGAPSILYTGILSTGVAYTLQIIGQKYTDPSVASIILSLESVVSVIGGYLFLGELLTPIEFSGCLFMFAGVLLAQRRSRK